MRRIALAVAAMALLAACGNAADDSSGAPASPQPNQADVAFVQGMIPHLQQAIEMAELIDGRSDRPELTELGAGSLGEVKQLAQQIITAQQREIQQMAAWKQAWSAPASG